MPYPLFVPENVMVPSAAALIGVPDVAAISSPVCVWFLTLEFEPYLELILPWTGVTAIRIPFIVSLFLLLAVLVSVVFFLVVSVKIFFKFWETVAISTEFTASLLLV